MRLNSEYLPASKFSIAHVMEARRELARRNVADFACMVDIPTVPIDDDDDDGFDGFSTIKLDSLAKHHKLILDKLNDLTLGKIPNLMLFFPPGAAKSTYADIVFVPWWMAQRPRNNVILASYASNIAKKQGRRARQLIKSQAYHNLTGQALRADTTAADEWALENGSEFMAGGLLSGLTGNRCGLGIIDDPIKGRNEAQSQTIRDNTWDAYQDDFCSRLIPGAPQLMILTRWHEDDPAGRILPEGWAGESGVFAGRDGREWHVLCCPAIAERKDDPLGREIGEILWPEWFSKEHFEPFKKDARSWTSLYQQRPAPDEGTFFQKVWFDRYTDKPANLKYYMTSDHAPGGEDHNDHNVVQVWGVDERQHIWLVDWHRSQETIDKAAGITVDGNGDQCLAEDGALPMIKKWKPLCWFPEDDNNWKTAKPFIKNAMRKLGARCRIEALSPHGQDKASKAQAFQAKATMGEVHIPAGFLGDAVIDEYVKFPAGKYDDQVDASANIGRAIDQAHPAIVGAKKEQVPDSKWARAFGKTKEESWKTM